ncbi:hypothetical protein TNCV_4369311 [Trichonephila clavipes]|nr:hypothetical protein TNCV_4369311 [Trichonephila clavipes]
MSLFSGSLIDGMKSIMDNPSDWNDSYSYNPGVISRSRKSSTSTTSNYATVGSFSLPSFISPSLSSSSSRMNRPVPPGTPYQYTNPANSTLSPKGPLMTSKDRGFSPATSQTINHDINRHSLSSSTQ